MPRVPIAALARLARCAALLLMLPVVNAQQLRIEGRVAPLSEVMVAVSDVPRAGGSFGVAAHIGLDPGAALSLRRSEAFGPIGTLVFEGDAVVRFGGEPAARLRASVRGGIGPIAARLEGEVHGAPPERFSVERSSGDGPYDRGGLLALALDGRPSRDLVLSGRSVAWLAAVGTESPAALTIDADAALRARRFLTPTLDATLALESRFAEGRTTHFAAGVGVVHAPRRAPEIAVQVWADLDIDAGVVRLLPGLASTGAWRGDAGRFAWSVTARPGSRSRAAWSADANWRHELGRGMLDIAFGARHGGRAGSAFQATVAWQIALASATLR